MSNVAVEHPRAFPTTIGFRVQGGFDLPSQPVPPCTPTASATSSSFLTSVPPLSTLPPANLQPASAEKDSSDAQSGLRASAQHAVQPFGSLVARLGSGALLHKPPRVQTERCATPSAVGPESPGPVGWKGLLEFSETSGCSGVLGPKPASEDLDTLLNRDCKIEICCTAHTNHAVRRLVKAVIRGLRACQEPDKATDGMGGTYFFSNEAGKKAAILKPCDEEPLAPNNPKGYVGRQLGDPGWKPTVRVGEAAIREVAAYLLDHDGWARVPTSVLVRARHPVFCYQASRSSGAAAAAAASSASAAPTPGAAAQRGASESAFDAAAAPAASAVPAMPATPDSQLPMKLGSLQEFVAHECDTSEMGPSRFSVRDVHRIGILDIRLFNTDRHAGNMLVRTPRTASASTADLRSRMQTPDAHYELIPIDHGFCLPETLEAPYFEWLHWPQTMLPFSEEELTYIRDLDVKRDIAILRQELPMLRPECLRVLEVCTTLLKTCAAAGLTLFDIASVMTRPFVDSDEEPSELERMCAFARQCVEYMTQCCEGADEDESESDSLADMEATIREEPLEEGIDMSPDACGAAAAPGAGGAYTRPRQGSSIGRIKEGAEDMLFDWEEDGSPGARLHKAKRRAAAAGMRAGSRDDAAESSPELSPCSSLSMGERMSIQQGGSIATVSSMVTSGGGPSDGSDGSALAPVPVPAAERPAPMASSVHVTDGFLWRKLKTQQAAKRAAGAKASVLACPKRAQQAYPPPVNTFSPERMSACFTDMSEEQWRQFMDVFAEQIHAALDAGQWRQAAAELASGMALSCPRF